MSRITEAAAILGGPMALGYWTIPRIREGQASKAQANVGGGGGPGKGIRRLLSPPPPGPFTPVGNLRALPASARVLRIL